MLNILPCQLDRPHIFFPGAKNAVTSVSFPVEAEQVGQMAMLPLVPQCPPLTVMPMSMDLPSLNELKNEVRIAVALLPSDGLRRLFPLLWILVVMFVWVIAMQRQLKE